MTSVVDSGHRRAADSGYRRVRRSRPVPDQDDLRVLFGIAFRPAAITIVLLSALIVVTLVAANSDLTGTFGAIGASWLAIHQVPLRIDDTALGVLPLFPTAVVVWAVARGCAAVVSTASTWIVLVRVIAAAVIGPLVVTAVSLAVIADAAAVLPLSVPGALAAFGWVFVIHFLAASIGVSVRIWPAVDRRIPTWVRGAVRPALRSTAAIFAAGGVAVTVSLLWGWSTVGLLLERGEGAIGTLGLTVLSVLYLPNVMIGAAAVLTGVTVQIGDVSIGLFGKVGGTLPPLPLLGAVPEGVAGGIWPALLVVPIAIGVLLGRDCGRHVSGQDALFTVLTAAAGVGVVSAVLGLAAGGELGVFGQVEIAWWSFGLLTFGWLSLVGAVTAVAVAWVRSRRETEQDQDQDGSAVAEESPAGQSHDREELLAIAGPDTGSPTDASNGAAGLVLEAEIVEDVEVHTSPSPSAVNEPTVVDAEVDEDSEGTGDPLPRA